MCEDDSEDVDQKPQQQLTSSEAENCTTITGELREEGESWAEDACTTCTCIAGGISCRKEICPEISCSFHEVQGYLPGDCCPSCLPRPIIDPPHRPQCQKEGVFMDTVNPCLRCYCHNSHTSCLDISRTCNPLPTNCKQVVRLSGQCCPVCQDEVVENSSSTPPMTCTFHGRDLADGESMSQGPCATCMCIHGEIACTQQSCPSLRCPQGQVPVYSADLCCPTTCGPSLTPTVIVEDPPKPQSRDLVKDAEDILDRNSVDVTSAVKNNAVNSDRYVQCELIAYHRV